MALASIEVLAGRGLDERRRLLRAVRQALVAALRVPVDDPTVRLMAHASDNFMIPERHSARYVLVTVTMFRGRTPETKRVLYEELVAELAKVDVPAGDVQVVLHEPPMENWSIGGTPASGEDPGFEVNI